MEEAWQQLTLNYPYLQTIWDALRVAVPLACLLAFAGLAFISATARILAIIKKRPAFDKCARQIALLALIFGWILLVGGRVWLYVHPAPQGSLDSFIFELGWLLLSLGVLLTTIYYTLWRILKNMPVLHSTLGMISGAQNCIALAIILFAIRISARPAPPAAETLKLPNLFPNVWYDPVWSAASFTLPLVFALAGAFSSCWLVLRRKRDDFGRDYYNAMLPWCAAWARNAWLILWLLFIAASGLQIWLNMKSGAFPNQEAILEAIRALFWLLPLLLWTMARKSKVPMRHKWGLFAALICACTFALPYFLDITLM